MIRSATGLISIWIMTMGWMATVQGHMSGFASSSRLSTHLAFVSGGLNSPLPTISSRTHHVILAPQPSAIPLKSLASPPLVSAFRTAPRRLVTQHVLQDLGGAVGCAVAATIWLKIWTNLAQSGALDSKDSRKLIHCGSGPLFLLMWPFFSADPSARLFAAGVPILQLIRLLIAGLTKPSVSASSSSTTNAAGKTNGLVAAISRSGNPSEVLRGPFIYTLVLLLATVLYWRTNVVGIIAISQMAAGDGMADIVGRRYGKAKWPWSKVKSYAGTLGFAVSAFVVSLGLVAWFHGWGLISLTPAAVALRVGIISVLCSLVELVPAGDDNITVPLAAAILAGIFFPDHALSLYL